jgi:hypothetical protein
MFSSAKLLSVFILFLSAQIAMGKEPGTGPAICFEENKGQLTDQHKQARNDILFYGHANGFDYYLKSNGISYQLYKGGHSEPGTSHPTLEAQRGQAGSTTVYRVDVAWIGANEKARIIRGRSTKGVNHYYNVSSPVTEVKNYEDLTYKNIYPSIDLKYYTHGENLKYDYVVRPGGDHTSIRFKIEGATSITQNEDGSLTIKTPLGNIEEGKPKVYQEGKLIRSKWQVSDDVLSFEIGEYDRAKTLTIDPLVFQWKNVIFPSYFVGFRGRDCTVDNNGNAFYCGQGWNGGGNGGPYFAFLRKVNSSNVTQFTSYFSHYTSSSESCVIDPNGNIYVVGWTYAPGTLATSGAYQTTIAGGMDAFLVKLDNSGVKLWGTFFGGGGDDAFNACSVDANGNIYASGSSTSSSGISTVGASQPAISGATDGIIAKFNASGTRIWATYYGGFNSEYVSGCALSTNSDLFICGRTNSSSGIATTGSFQSSLIGNTNGFLATLDTNGNRLWATYFGSDSTTTEKCSLDSLGNIYVCGGTTAVNNISTSGVFQAASGGLADGYLAKFNAAGSRIWTTYVGGSGVDAAFGCYVRNGSVYVCGTTASTNNIATVGAYQSTYDTLWPYGSTIFVTPPSAAFLQEFDSMGQRKWGTYHNNGTVYYSQSFACHAAANGDVYLCGNEAGRATSTQGTPFLIKFNPYTVSTPIIAANPAAVICSGGAAQLGTALIAGATYQWYKNDTALVGETSATYAAAVAGSYKVSVLHNSSPAISQPVNITVLGLPQTQVTKVNVTCNGAGNGTISINPSGTTAPYTTTWTNPAVTSSAITNLVPGAYIATTTDANGCSRKDTVVVTEPTAISAAKSTADVLCFGGSNGTVALTVSGGTVPYTYSWNGTPGSSSASNLVAGVYYVTVTDGNNCTKSDTVMISQPSAISNTKTSVNVSCHGSNTGTASVNVAGGVPPYTYLWNNSATSSSLSNLPSGSYTVLIKDNNNCQKYDTVNITQPSSAVATSVGSSNISCNGAANGAISISASGGTPSYTYSWNSLTSTLPSVSNLQPGTYIATTSDANNCLKKDTVVITQPVAMSIFKTKTNVSCFGGVNGTAGVTVNGGISPYTYSWSNAALISAINTLAAGTYTIVVTDNNNCVKTDSVIVTQPTPLNAAKSAVNVSCHGSNNGSATVIASGGVAPYSYAWNNNGTTTSINNLVAGNYSVLITDNNSCTRSDSFIITQPSSLLTTSLSLLHNGCYNDSAGKAFVLAGGGTSPYSYSWVKGTTVASTTDSATSLKAGTYVLTTVDANQCNKLDTFSIAEPPQALINICAVTIDSATGKNLVIWEKTGIQNAAVYKIFRESSVAGQFNLIGASPSSQYSTFLDTGSIPLQQSYSYKMSVIDSCNSESPLSVFHKTIHLTSNVGVSGEVNLLWNAYEGSSYTTHYIMRSVNGGPFAALAQVASTSLSYTDLTTPAGQKVYRIDIDLPTTCSPSAKTTSFSRISSNTVSLGTNGIESAASAGMQIIPNPTTGVVRVIGIRPTRLDVIDALGKTVRQAVNTSVLYLADLAPGIYMVRLFDRNGLLYYYEKVVKE